MDLNNTASLKGRTIEEEVLESFLPHRVFKLIKDPIALGRAPPFRKSVILL